MGFFSDLKEDLSQAVNELLQEDESIKAQPEAEATEAVEESAEQEVQPKGDTVEQTELSLEALLENIDSYELSEEEISLLQNSGEEPAEELKEPEMTEPETTAEVTFETEMTEEINLTEDENLMPADQAGEDEVISDELLSQWLNEELERRQRPEAVEMAEVTEQEITEMPEDGWKENSVAVENEGVEEKMEARTERIALDETAVITAGMTITGDVSSEGSMDLVGTVNGNIDVFGKLNVSGHINGNSKAAEIYADGAKIYGEVVSQGAVKIGASTVIIGNISATSAAIAGAVKGDIDVTGPVILDASAIVMGNIKSKSVQINNGAVIEGMCSQCYAEVSPTSFFDEYK